MGRRKQKGLGVHAHGCQQCEGRYEDACEVATLVGKKSKKWVRKPGPDKVCPSCRYGRPVFWPEAWYPRACCVEYGRPATKGELETYNLAGQGPWFICPECSRTFPYTHPKNRRQHEFASSTQPV